MIELILLVVAVFVSYYIGQVVMLLKLRQLAVNEIVTSAQAPAVKQLFVERMDNVLYLYERELGSFICQGSTLEELAKLAKEYKHIKYAAVVDEQNKNVVAFVDGKVEENLMSSSHES